MRFSTINSYNYDRIEWGEQSTTLDKFHAWTSVHQARYSRHASSEDAPVDFLFTCSGQNSDEEMSGRIMKELDLPEQVESLDGAPPSLSSVACFTYSPKTDFANSFTVTFLLRALARGPCAREDLGAAEAVGCLRRSRVCSPTHGCVRCLNRKSYAPIATTATIIGPLNSGTVAFEGTTGNQVLANSWLSVMVTVWSPLAAFSRKPKPYVIRCASAHILTSVVS